METASVPNLYLLIDHLKLSLLERQRAISLNLDPNSNDGQISRSLDQLQSGISALESQSSQWDDPLHPSSDQQEYTILKELLNKKANSSTLQSPRPNQLPQGPIRGPPLHLPRLIPKHGTKRSRRLGRLRPHATNQALQSVQIRSVHRLPRRPKPHLPFSIALHR